MKKKINNILSKFYTIYNILLFTFKSVSYEEMPRTNGRLIIRGKGKLIIGKDSTITSLVLKNPVGLGYKTFFYITEKAVITLGDNIGISNTLFYARKEIVIEDNVLIGGGCQIYDTDFHSLDYHERVFNGDNDVKVKPVRIKEGAFIGTSCIILKGVTIGARSIVAAGAVVAKDIPDNEIWGGNPAKMLKKIDVK